MEYKYVPIFKYIIFALIAFMFLNYEKLVDQTLLFQIVSILTFIFIVLDMVIIKEHPMIINFNDDDIDEKDEKKNNTNEEDIENNDLPIVDESIGN